MDVRRRIADLEWLRRDIIGRNMMFATPYGERPLVYADYTASGRGLHSIENHLQRVLQFYANTHTEDDFTGQTMTRLFHEAERTIKRIVNAGPDGRIIFTESGSTGAITRLQQILGVFWSPATHERINEFLRSCLLRYPAKGDCNQQLLDYIAQTRPIVFIGPYEHHSNEIMWRQTLCDIVEIPLGEDSGIDLARLEAAVSDPQYAHRCRIGSFSAASNVSGLKTDVYAVARILHRHGAIACFDFAACAPYVPIDMNRDPESRFDAIFLSPHKYLGGPGTSGILVINKKIYPETLPPTVAAGGTVEFVSQSVDEYVKDIETREKPGTPGILQTLRSCLAFQLKERVGTDAIEEIERHYYNRFMDAFKDEPGIIFYGPLEFERKVPIIPFNIRHQDRMLHPKFVTRLLNDLFGIQTRAGCACAGPYGHSLLNIGKTHSAFYRCLITNAGYAGFRPGFARLNLHYSMDEAELDYLIAALKFAVAHAHRFLPSYVFDIKSGIWEHRSLIGAEAANPIGLDIETVYAGGDFVHAPLPTPVEKYREALADAESLAASLPEDFTPLRFVPEMEELLYFYVAEVKNHRESDLCLQG